MLDLAGPHPLIHWQSLWVIIAAFLAGMLNAVAGGGSFLSFPAMLGTGMLPVHANATNTMALWSGQVTSIAAYREEIRKHARLLWPVAIASVLGAISGAWLLLHMPQKTFMRQVPWLLLIAASIFAFSRPILRWLERRNAARNSGVHVPRKPHRVAVFISIFAICIYVGYFGAGGGLVTITILTLFGIESLHESNAIKVVSTTLANGTACIIFAFTRQIEWRYCLLAMAACAVGGYVSARTARRVPQPMLRAFIIVLGLSMAAWYFYKTR
ncbi:MAG: sulfite exporter TauE/SafE family protein [Acidobacteriota bacterium]